MPAVAFENLDIVFGKRVREALALIDQGKTRDEILAATGAVLGAAGVNLAIERSEICVLMGLSGSGKSTILRAVNGLNKVARGKVLVEHENRTIDVAKCSADELRMLRTRRIAMVFQQFALLPWRTVAENVGFGLELRGVEKSELDRIVADKLAMVGLTKWAGKMGHELSGGMQQRVGIVRSLVHDPSLLLMDEPFGALDALTRERMSLELQRLWLSNRKTVVFITHSIPEAVFLSDRVLVMSSRPGRIIDEFTIPFARPRSFDLTGTAEFGRHATAIRHLLGATGDV